MPSLSASLQSNVRSDERARARRQLAAAAVMTWLAVCLFACRDMREDANYCSSCTSGEISDGTVTGPQSMDPGSESSGTSDPPSSSGGRTAGSMTSTSNQAGTGNGSQAASAAASSGGASAASGSSSSVPTAGARGPQAGAAARGGNTSNSEPNSSERDAGNGDTGSNGMRDAGSQEPNEPAPTPDAGSTTPPLPCNGQCPNDRPVCDETKAVPQCVQCTAQEQFACVGATSTCDVEQQKCVQCTPDDARHCDGATPTCNQDNRCVVCTRELPTSCPGAQPLCDNEQRCVECLPGRTEYCTDNRTMCSADGRCVECMDDAQCGDPMKPRCDRETNSCVGCDRAQDCAKFPGASICDEESKKCVACSPTGDLCPVGQYCDRAIYQCLQAPPKKSGCAPCELDSECAESPSIAACLNGQQESGKFCFTATLAAPSICDPGYTAVRGPAGIMYCMPFNSLSCTAINHAASNDSCDDNNDCGRGGQCPMAPSTCKLSCSDSQPCPAPFFCDSSAMPKVCKRP
jgi:hypothetical protein